MGHMEPWLVARISGPLVGVRPPSAPTCAPFLREWTSWRSRECAAARPTCRSCRTRTSTMAGSGLGRRGCGMSLGGGAREVPSSCAPCGHDAIAHKATHAGLRHVRGQRSAVPRPGFQHSARGFHSRAGRTSQALARADACTRPRFAAVSFGGLGTCNVRGSQADGGQRAAPMLEVLRDVEARIQAASTRFRRTRSGGRAIWSSSCASRPRAMNNCQFRFASPGSGSARCAATWWESLARVSFAGGSCGGYARSWVARLALEKLRCV